MSYVFAAGSSQRIRRGTTLGGVSFSLWFYPTDSGDDCTIFSESNAAATRYYAVQILGSTTDNLQINSTDTGGVGTVTSTGTVNYNAWNHVYCAIGGASPTHAYISLNGETLVDGGAGSYVAPGAATVPNLGSLVTSAGSFYSGRLAEFAAWDNNLSDFDDRYKCLSKGFDPRLVPVDANGSYGLGALNMVSYFPMLGNVNDRVLSTAWIAVNTPTIGEHCRVFQPICG
jgi:hypothetical protein